MALKDIVSRIENDTQSEAGKILAETQREAEALLEAARNQAASAAHESIERATRGADAQAGAIVAAARLRARDAMIAEKHALLDRVLREAVARVESLPDDEYATILVREAIAILRDDERIEVGRHDAERVAERISSMLRDAGFDVSVDVATGAAEKGVVVHGKRVYAEISVAALVQERRFALEAIAADCLFGTERGTS